MRDGNFAYQLGRYFTQLFMASQPEVADLNMVTDDDYHAIIAGSRGGTIIITA